ncbi:MAG: AbrB/MazE/SpoVT family DNA-binding domain-containing protein [Nitrososphaerales archaeon]
MSESILELKVTKVTRKGQITIPASYRKKYKIREGQKIVFKEERGKIVMEPILRIEDLAGIDAGRISVSAAKKMLDKMRAQDRY